MEFAAGEWECGAGEHISRSGGGGLWSSCWGNYTVRVIIVTLRNFWRDLYMGRQTDIWLSC